MTFSWAVVVGGGCCGVAGDDGHVDGEGLREVFA